MEPELQLLMIDMGDACVVKVEKGDKSWLKYRDDNVACSSFQMVTGTVKMFRFNDNPQTCDFNTFADIRAAIEQKPVPVWSGGTWTEYPVSSEHTFNDTGVKIWRYTR